MLNIQLETNSTKADEIAYILTEYGAVSADFLLYEVELSKEGLRRILKVLEEAGYVLVTPHGGKWRSRKILAGVNLLPYLTQEAYHKLIVRGIDEAIRQTEIQYAYANRSGSKELANMIQETHRLLRHILGVVKLALETDA